MENKTNKSMKLSSKDIIAMRDKLCAQKTHDWKIIISENVMSKKAIANGLGARGKGIDLNNLYNSILQTGEKIIKIKGMLQYLNMGTFTFNFDDFKKTHYYKIFLLSEKNELFCKLEELLKKNTINPNTKAKAGKKGTGLSEIFSSAKIASMKKKLQLEINSIKTDIENYNNSTTIDISSESDNFETIFAA